MLNNWETELQKASNLALSTRLSLRRVMKAHVIDPTPKFSIKTNENGFTPTSFSAEENKIFDSLLEISPALARSYSQVIVDLRNEQRTSWAGTAHEIREVLSTTLRILAPDKNVIDQAWYIQDPETSGPTQKQRVRYILQQHNAGSKEREVAEQVFHLEDMIGNLVRAIYSRASDAAHRSKEKREVARIVNYFNAFAFDLLDL